MNKAQELLEINKEKFDELYVLYADYNAHTNISAIRDRDDVTEKHFLDSLELLNHQDLTKASKVIDLGSGGGFPVLPLAIVAPEIKFFALDATAKKTKFIEEVKEKLDLKNLNILTGRAEDFAHIKKFREDFDFVLVRALASLNILFELASGFVKKDGYLLAYKSAPIFEEEEQAKESQEKTGFVFETRFQVSKERQILKYKKKTLLNPDLPREFSKIKSKPL